MTNYCSLRTTVVCPSVHFLYIFMSDVSSTTYISQYQEPESFTQGRLTQNNNMHRQGNEMQKLGAIYHISVLETI